MFPADGDLWGMIMYRLPSITPPIYLLFFSLILTLPALSIHSMVPIRWTLNRGDGRKGESREDCGINSVYDNWFQSSGSDGTAAVM